MSTKQTILVIEDEKEILDDLVKILTLSDYNVISAGDGEEGLKMAIESHPDLILSDILIPGKTGYELLRDIQSVPETSTIPFLFLSAKSNKFDVREAMNLGADDFITKPFDLDELLGTIKIRLEKKVKRESHFSQKIENLQTNLRKTMPHEIRTPLNVILGFSEFLMKNNKNIHDAEAMDMISNIYTSGQRLQRTFENYLLYANLELISASSNEKNKFQQHSTFMADVFIKEIAFNKAIEYSRESDLTLELIDSALKIYEDHLRKVVEELIDNSFKFSEIGKKVVVKSKITDNLYVLEVVDEGRGMTQSQIEGLGEFVQFDRTTFEQQGTGLGLSIVRRIVDIYNGQIEIQSFPDKFTKVLVCLPIYF